MLAQKMGPPPTRPRRAGVIGGNATLTLETFVEDRAKCGRRTVPAMTHAASSLYPPLRTPAVSHIDIFVPQPRKSTVKRRNVACQLEA